jgi:hypothetical protein
MDQVAHFRRFPECKFATFSRTFSTLGKRFSFAVGHDTMTTKSMQSDAEVRSTILKGAVISGIINAVINGGIQWWLLAKHAPIALSVDSITSTEHTVFGSAVPLAVSLAMILTGVAFPTIKGPKPPFFPLFVGLIVKHGFFALGIIVTFAVLWQRMMGSIEVSLLTAVIILGVIAGLVSAVVNYMTLMEAHRRTPATAT